LPEIEATRTVPIGPNGEPMTTDCPGERLSVSMGKP
jgi:hypothetical protein